MSENASENVEMIRGELCPFCNEKKLTLMDSEREIPYFGLVNLFSMTCAGCKYHKADVESAEKRDPVKITFPVTCEEDMSVRVVKSASATVKLPRIMTMNSTELSNGYITNVEGVLTRAKKVLEGVRDTTDDNDEAKKAKKLIKKLQDIMWGRDSLTITIEDSTGVSGIISDKAVVSKGKK
ncbi:MAG: ZPR1-related zinc finger protein [Candidatus Woesearchaeota archaeon]|jgi:ZPR1-related zinc finger protein